MLKTVSIKTCRIDDSSAVVLGGDVFFPLKENRKKSKRIRYLSEYCKKILDALSEGLFCGLITELEYGIARDVAGEHEFYRFLNERIKPSEKARFFRVMVVNVLDEYRQISAYKELFKIVDTKGLHTPSMTSIITAVELKKPLVSYANDLWKYQKHIHDAYAERNNVKGLPLMFIPQDFYKSVLKSL